MPERDNEPSVFSYFRSIVGPDVESATDKDLLTRYIERHDPEAFELLMWRHVAMVHRVCREVIKDHHTAEDAAQAVFLMLARQAVSIRHREKVAAWLYRAAYRLSLRAKKRKGRDITTPFSAMREVADCSVAETDAPELKALVMQAISHLPEKYRQVVILCYLEDMTHVEAAKRLGLPTGTVAAQAHRAKAILQRALSRKGLTTTAAAALGILAPGSSEAANKLVVSTVAAAMKFASGQNVLPGVSNFAVELARWGARDAVRTYAWLSVGAFLATGLVAAGSIALNGPLEPSNAPMPQDVSRFREVIAPLPVKPKDPDKLEISAWEKLGAVYGMTTPCDRDELFRLNMLSPNAYEKLTLSHFSVSLQARDFDSCPGFRIPAGSAAAKRLNELPKIDSPFALDLSDAAVTDADIRAVVKNHKLSMLAVSGDSFTDDAMKAIASLKSLTHLEISGGKITDSGIQQLTRLPELTRLHLNCPLMTDDGIAQLADMKKLTSLSLVGAKLGDAAVVHISALEKLNQLFLVAPQVTDDGLEPIEKLKKLEFLAIHSHHKIGPGLAHVAKLTGLTHLDIGGAGMRKEGPLELKALQSLRHIKFACWDQADEAVRNLAVLKDLKQIDISHSDLSDAGLADFAKFESLEQLSVFSTVIEGPGFSSLSSVKNLRELQIFCYSDEKGISYDGLKSWNGLKRLEHVGIYSHIIRPDAIKHLAALKNVSRLDLYAKGHMLDAKGIKLLQGMTNLKQLKIKVPIIPDMVKEIGRIKGLTHLSFISEAFDDEKLASLTDLTDLVELEIDAPRVTDDGIHRFTKRIPNCVVARPKSTKFQH